MGLNPKYISANTTRFYPLYFKKLRGRSREIYVVQF